MADQFLYMDVVVRVRHPEDCLRGRVTGVVAGASLTLSDVYSMAQNRWLPSVVLEAQNIVDVTNAVDTTSKTTTPAPAAPMPVQPEVLPAAPNAAQAAAAYYTDPAIVSVGQRNFNNGSSNSSVHSVGRYDPAIVSAGPAPVPAVNNLPIRSRALLVSNTNSSRSSSVRSATRYVEPAATATAAEPVSTSSADPNAAAADEQTTTVIQAGAPAKTRQRQKDNKKRGKLNTNIVPDVANGRVEWTPTAERPTAAELPKPPASVRIGAGAGAGATSGAKKSSGRRRVQQPAAGAWASENATDVQGMGDFDFQGSLAKFDKRAVFAQMRREDHVDETQRLVAHNRRSGTRNLHHTENVLSMSSQSQSQSQPQPPPPTTAALAAAAAAARLAEVEAEVEAIAAAAAAAAAAKKVATGTATATAAAAAEATETTTESDTYFEDNTAPAQPHRPAMVATDFWNSDADDTAATVERLSPRNGSRQSSRRGDRGDSKVRRPQARKTSAAVHAQGPRRMQSVTPATHHDPAPSFCVVPSGRRIGSVSALQMLNLENIAHNELGLTEDMMTENAGRGIAEVALTALADPAVKIRSGTKTEETAFRNNTNGNGIRNGNGNGSGGGKRTNRHRRRPNGNGNGDTTPKAPAAPTVVILAGNNKSGMRAVAGGRHLQNRGVSVLVCVVGLERGERALQEGLRQQIRVLQNLGGRVYSKAALFEHLRRATLAADTASQQPVTLIVDALLGLSEAFDELRTGDQATVYELMEWANRNEAFVVAVDVPSGLDASTGAVGRIDGQRLYVQPRYVVALGAPKRGLLEVVAAGGAKNEGDGMDAFDDDDDENDDDEDEDEDEDDDGDVTLPATTVMATTVADDPARDWQLFVADIGLAAAVWRKGGLRQRQGVVDFGAQWVVRLRYEGGARGTDSGSSTTD